jgi:hypothetical protein
VIVPRTDTPLTRSPFGRTAMTPIACSRPARQKYSSPTGFTAK